MKIDRLLGIIMQLINKDKVTAKDLAEKYEVSIRTIQRDMETLNMAGIPLYADKGKNGGYALLDNYKLSKSFLSKNEASVLIKFLENLDSLGASKEINTIYNKFQLTNTNLGNDDKLVIKLNPLIGEGFLTHHLKMLSSARDSQNKVRIKYLDVSLNETYRVIHPYTLVMINTTWYVYGYCELREDFRMFKLNRVINTEILNETYTKYDMPLEKPWENEESANSAKEKVILRVDNVLLGKIPDFFYYNCCIVNENHTIVRLETVIGEWLYSVLLSLTPYVAIIEPSHLKKNYIKRLQEGLNKNK